MTSKTSKRLLAPGLVCALAVLAFGSSLGLAASPDGPTRGEARGVFQAFFTGGAAIRAHDKAEGVPGVPVEPTPDGARIYPSGLEGAEYCEHGWHVILLGIFDDPAFYGGNRELFDYLSAVDIQFVLDGVPLEVDRTAIKRLSHPEPFSEQAFAVGFGAFLPPGSLAVGAHEVQTLIHDPVFGDFDYPTGFTVIPC